ncbi:MAG: hypothetical protein WCI73_07920 [Phycisphaerae bacterium]
MVATVAPAKTTPDPAKVLHFIMNLIHEAPAIAENFDLTLPELQSYLNSPEFHNYLQLVESIEHLRQQMLVTQHTALSLGTLASLADRGSHEIARRAATTILTIAGLVPAKSPAPKPWEQTTLTKQHMPTYNNSTTVKPPVEMKPATSGGAGPATSTPTESPNPTTLPSTCSPAQLLSCSLDLPTPATNSAFISSLTKQHMPTYSDSPLSLSTSRRARQSQILQQAVYSVGT